jgi:hypothetical protein
MISYWSAPYTIGKIILRAYKICLSHAQNRLDVKKIRGSKILGQQKSQFWDSHLGVLNKMSFGCSLMERHKVYYREGSGASS